MLRPVTQADGQHTHWPNVGCVVVGIIVSGARSHTLPCVDIGRWSWAGQERYPGFCLTLVHRRDPRTVAQALGAHTLTVLTLAEAEYRFPIGAAGALLRLGTSHTWTYCFEDRAPIANREPAIARLSAGTRLLQVTKSGDGMTVLRDVVDGRNAAASLQARLDTIPADCLRIVAALAVVAAETGIELDRATLDGPLDTAYSTLSEPAFLR